MHQILTWSAPAGAAPNTTTKPTRMTNVPAEKVSEQQGRDGCTWPPPGPAHEGQMKLYLKRLDRYERQDGEEAPIGLILCTEASREQIELLEMHKDGIVVAEYWTALPPKEELQRRIAQIYQAARERVARRQISTGHNGGEEV